MKVEVIVEEKYKLTLDLPQATSQEMKEKLSAFKMLCEKLNHPDLMSAAELIRERPKLIPAVKEILEDAKDKGEIAMLTSAPSYIRKIMKIVKGE